MILKKELLKAIVDKWGEDAQIDMLFEEFGELMSAINKFKRGRVGIDSIQEEVADCLLMLDQMAYIVGESEVQVFIGEKSERIKERLNKKGG